MSPSEGNVVQVSFFAFISRVYYTFFVDAFRLSVIEYPSNPGNKPFVVFGVRATRSGGRNETGQTFPIRRTSRNSQLALLSSAAACVAVVATMAGLC